MGAVYKSLVAGLNANQYNAVIAPTSKALQILAGPGTGKTKVITSKVAFLLLHHNLPPESIIVTTFTKKAANEMVERLKVLLAPYPEIKLNKLFIGTFHSICVRILRSYGKLIGMSPQFKIADETDANQILKKILQGKDLTGIVDGKLKESDVKKFRGFISSCKAKAELPQQVPTNSKDRLLSIRLDVYTDYQLALNKSNLIDFDDCLLSTYNLLKDFPDCMRNIKHVLVDEFQDTNMVQLNLMYQFGNGHKEFKHNVTIVGDPDQSIYGFRNAEAKNFFRMEEYYKSKGCDLLKVSLDQNYRSTTNILNISEALMKSQYDEREAKFLKSNKPQNQSVVFSQVDTNKSEAKNIVSQIVKLVPKDESTFKYSDVAILLRSGYLSRVIEQELIHAGLPYQVIHGRTFWELKEIKVMIDYLRVVASDLDWLGFNRTLDFQIRGLGAKTLQLIESKFDAEKQSGLEGNVFQLLSEIVKNGCRGVSGNVTASLKVYLSIISESREILNDENLDISVRLDKMFEFILKKTQLVSTVADTKKKEKEEAEKDILENIGELKSQLLNFNLREETMLMEAYDDLFLEQNDDGAGIEEEEANQCFNHLSQFLDSVYLYEESNNKATKETTSRVTITTIHGAKGLEWPIVFVPSLSDGIFPSQYALGETDEIRRRAALDEERRCLYVALTRAKELLFMSSFETTEGFSFNDNGCKQISSLVSSIPKNLYEKRVIRGGGENNYGGSYSRYSQTTTMDRYKNKRMDAYHNQFSHIPSAGNTTNPASNKSTKLFQNASKPYSAFGAAPKRSINTASSGFSTASGKSFKPHRNISIPNSTAVPRLSFDQQQERKRKVDSVLKTSNMPPMVSIGSTTGGVSGGSDADLICIGTSTTKKKKRLGMGRPPLRLTKRE